MRLTVTALTCFMLAGCVQVGPAGTPAANTTSTPSAISRAADSRGSAASGPRFSQPPVSPPTPPSTTIPGFACSDSSGGKTGVANVTDARLSEQSSYDRFVLQFDGPVPSYTVKRQDHPTFPMGASGQTITLSGVAGALVTVHSATEANTYTGPADFTHAEYLVIKEARLTQDFEGYVSWGLGLDHPACMRTFVLTGPSRLVVDFSTATS